MGMAGLHRVVVGVECECGTNVEADDVDELVDELQEHIAAAHEHGLQRDTASMLAAAYED